MPDCDLCGDIDGPYAEFTFLRVRGIDIAACDGCLEDDLVRRCDACGEWMPKEEAYACDAQRFCAWCAYTTDDEDKGSDWPRTAEEVHARIATAMAWIKDAVEEARYGS